MTLLVSSLGTRLLLISGRNSPAHFREQLVLLVR